MDYYNQPNEDAPIDQDAVSILFIIWYKNFISYKLCYYYYSNKLIMPKFSLTLGLQVYQLSFRIYIIIKII